MTETTTRVRQGQDLDYPFDTRPEPGEAIEIVPGILWVRMRLPFQLNHINLWLLEDGDGWTVVDTGVRDEPTAEAWKRLFVGPWRVARQAGDCHPSPSRSCGHGGLAGAPLRRHAVDVAHRLSDVPQSRRRYRPGSPKEGIDFYHAAGFPEEMLENYRTRFGGFGKGVYRMPNSYRRIVDGEEIEIGRRTWQVVVGRGHAPEHACLWCKELNIFISGDQICREFLPTYRCFRPSLKPILCVTG